jgi:hypothetical protein
MLELAVLEFSPIRVVEVKFIICMDYGCSMPPFAFAESRDVSVFSFLTRFQYNGRLTEDKTPYASCK